MWKNNDTLCCAEASLPHPVIFTSPTSPPTALSFHIIYPPPLSLGDRYRPLISALLPSLPHLDGQRLNQQLDEQHSDQPDVPLDSSSGADHVDLKDPPYAGHMEGGSVEGTDLTWGEQTAQGGGPGVSAAGDEGISQGAAQGVGVPAALAALADRFLEAEAILALAEDPAWSPSVTPPVAAPWALSVTPKNAASSCPSLTPAEATAQAHSEAPMVLPPTSPTEALPPPGGANPPGGNDPRGTVGESLRSKPGSTPVSTPVPEALSSSSRGYSSMHGMVDEAPIPPEFPSESAGPNGFERPPDIGRLDVEGEGLMSFQIF